MDFYTRLSSLSLVGRAPEWEASGVRSHKFCRSAVFVCYAGVYGKRTPQSSERETSPQSVLINGKNNNAQSLKRLTRPISRESDHPQAYLVVLRTRARQERTWYTMEPDCNPTSRV